MLDGMAFMSVVHSCAVDCIEDNIPNIIQLKMLRSLAVCDVLEVKLNSVNVELHLREE